MRVSLLTIRTPFFFSNCVTALFDRMVSVEYSSKCNDTLFSVKKLAVTLRPIGREWNLKAVPRCYLKVLKVS